MHDVLFHTFLSLLCCHYLVVILKYDTLWMGSYSYITYLVLCTMKDHFQLGVQQILDRLCQLMGSKTAHV